MVSWRGEVARRRKSHGGGGSTSGGFVGWKNEQGFYVCGSWVVLGSLAEKSRKKKCAGMFHVKIYVCHFESVPKVVGVLIPIKFVNFFEQSCYPITSSRRLLVKVGVNI